MKQIPAASIAALVVSLAACNNNGTPPLTGAFRVVNGIPDSTTLDASIANVPTDSQNINFGTASGIADIPEGSYDAQLTPSDSTKKFSVDNVNIDHNNLTTVFATGLLANGTQRGFTAEENLGGPSSSQFNVQYVNAAYSESLRVAKLTVRLIAPGASILGNAGVATTYGAPASGSVSTIAAGTYEIVVTDALDRKIFDSGSKGVALPPTDSNVLQLAILDASSTQSSTYGSPITLLVLDNNGGNTPLLDGQN